MKYDVRFCSCGRVHFIEQDKVSKAIENEKQVLVVCGNCGSSYVIGADKENDYNGEKCYMMYSYSMRSKTLDDLSNIDCIIFTQGEQVRMMTNGEATYHGASIFIDWDTKKPDNKSEDEWDKMRKTVNTQHTINWIRDEEKIEQMSHYLTGIDWTGTKYEMKF